MKIGDLLKLSTRMFKARTSQTLLTICGMSVGIGAILFLVSLGYGLQKTLLERITTLDSLLTLDVTESKAGTVGLSQKTINDIKNFEGVAEVSSAFQLTAQGTAVGLSADIIAVGTDPAFLRLGGFKVSKGKSLDDEHLEGVVITSATAQLFGKNVEEIIGQDIKFTFFISEEKNETKDNFQENLKKIDFDKIYKITGLIEGEDNVVYVNSKTLSDFNVDKFTQLKVKCKDSAIMGLIRDRIVELGLSVSSLSDTVDQANKIFGVAQIILMLFGVIALIVSAIGMFNTMTIALLERTEEIGIMKSIGAGNMTIAAIFFMEAAIMGFLGGVGGIIIGLIGGELFNTLINIVATRFGGEKVDIFYSPVWFVFMILIFSALVGILTGFIPARRASKVDPLEALRYK